MTVLLIGTLPAFSATDSFRRVALLIGNASYRNAVALANPGKDVELMRGALTQAGFDVVETQADLDRAKMIETLRAFETVANGADIALIYFSGHGMEVDGQNYVLPTDVQLRSDRDIQDEAVSLERVQRSIDGAHRFRLVILDACRTNPFEAGMKSSRGATRAVSKGLARIEPEGADNLVAYAAKAGTVALDGDQGNSPFAVALAKRLVQPGLDVRIALGQVRDDVLAATGQQQEPFVYGSLGGVQIVLAKVDVSVTINPPAPADGKAGDVSDAALTADVTFWKSVDASRDPADFEAYLAKFPNGTFATLAKNQLAALGGSAAPPPTLPAPAEFTPWMETRDWQAYFNAMLAQKQYPVKSEGKNEGGRRYFRAMFAPFPSARFGFYNYVGQTDEKFAATDQALRQKGYKLLSRQTFVDKDGVANQATWIPQ